MLLNVAIRRSYCYRPVKRWKIFKDLNEDSTKKGEVAINLAKHIRNRIIATGPITVAQYMTEVLTHPTAGYYMNRDVFGLSGDFITSPEISQIFGELVAVWIVNEWVKLGSPQPFQLIELGPGRGTLIKDILRVLTQLKLSEKLSLHLVEISEFLSQLQAQSICFEFEKLNDCTLPYYQIGKSESGCAVYWYKRLEDIPQDFAIILAHEFFDAMPVHKLKLMAGLS
ncbi:protein arginine methyltransferase NDUFAF7 homolog, mitochondrial-like [Teleopsis dalmanni]|uniref:protein arginine methyltransferase NDUFAF7 homolog, mitochondrial-like n=1 Tax=Teleopsis dalmanni TaxID=139649 RepID=UPI0018CEB3A7|nr:protein arginine methyltransferase NDUFAF7 homolog, mitochondrial-like [Teleopsis dalmanni]